MFLEECGIHSSYMKSRENFLYIQATAKGIRAKNRERTIKNLKEVAPTNRQHKQYNGKVSETLMRHE